MRSTRRSTCAWTRPPTTTAADFVNELDERELEIVFRRYGEERFARAIAREIGRRRRQEPFERTGQLVDTIKAAIPAPARFGDGHPARRVFQALRIAVNDELGQLDEALPAAVEMLRPGGRVAVISFHSLEDRIVKRYFRDEQRGCICPPDFPICACGREPAAPRRDAAGGAAERARDSAQPARRLGAASRRGEDGVSSVVARAGSRTPSSTCAASSVPASGCSRAASPGSSRSPSSSPASSRSTSPSCSGTSNLDGVNRQRAQLKADIAADQAKLASAKRTGNIVQGVPGLTEADPAATTLIDLPR